MLTDSHFILNFCIYILIPFVYKKRLKDVLQVKIVQLKPNQTFITLGQLLKSEGIVSTGGQIKWFLEENPVMINDELEVRRGKKLWVNDKIIIQNHGEYIIAE